MVYNKLFIILTKHSVLDLAAASPTAPATANCYKPVISEGITYLCATKS